jgi:biotin-(acetyl-CoA carboxylase) ligase
MLGICELKVFEVNGERFQGTIQGISKEGALEMLVDGQLKQYVQGEITLVPLGAS